MQSFMKMSFKWMKDYFGGLQLVYAKYWYAGIILRMYLQSAYSILYKINIFIPVATFSKVIVAKCNVGWLGFMAYQPL